MIIGLLFWMLALISCGYAVAFGGKPGRWAAFLIVAASILTVVAAHMGRAWGQLETARFVVDVMLLVALYVLMVLSRRFWPIWMTGFHLIAVTTHVSVIIAPGVTPQIYRALESLWAIPVLLALLAGVELDRRAASGRGPAPTDLADDRSTQRR